MALMLIITLSFSTYVTYQSNRSIITEANHQLLLALNEQAEHFLFHPRSELELIGNALINPTPDQDSSVRINLIVSQFNYLKRVELLDASGKITATYPAISDRIGLDLSGADPFKLLTDNELIYGDTFIDTVTNTPTLSVFSRITQDLILVGYLDLSHLESAFKKLAPSGGNLAIIDDKGMYVFHNNSALVFQRAVDKNAKLLRENTFKNNTITFVDNKPYILQYEPIENTKWHLLIYRPLSQIYGPIMWTLIVSIGATLLIFILVGINLSRFLRKFNASLQSIVEMSKSVSQGKFDLLRTSHPYAEFDELSTSFQQMVSEVESREEEINAYIDALESNQRILDYQLLLEQRISEMSSILLSLEIENAESRYREALSGLSTSFNLHGAQLLLSDDSESSPDRWKSYAVWLTEDHPCPNLNAQIFNMLTDNHNPPNHSVDVCGEQVDIQVMKADNQIIGALLLYPKESNENRTTLEAHFLSIVTNIFYETHKKYLFEKALMDSREAAQASSLAKGQFLANMSHEIRTPMNGIFGYLELLKENVDDPELKGYLSDMETVSKGLLRIINDILDLSKIESGRFSITSEPYNIIETIEEAAALHLFEARRKDITLLTKIDPLFPISVIGDGERLKQVLYNLLHNAIKFTNKGVVQVALQLDTESMNKPIARIEVADQGIGIKKGFIPNLFTPFSQADVTNTRKYGGTGLGLSITKQIVDAMGGTISVVSEEGHGTTFTLLIPIQLDQSEKVEVSKETHIITPTNRPVLIVDDNLVNQLVVRKVLEGKGIKCEIASDGLEAYEKVKTGSYAAVFMDCQMPIMDGYESTRNIRNLPGGRSVKIIAMTANAMVGDEEKCLEAGMDAYLSKPIDYKKMLAMIQN